MPFLIMPLRLSRTPPLILAVVLGLPALPAKVDASAGELASAVVQPAGSGSLHSADGVIEPVRDTSLAAQVSGAVVQLQVRVGDRVREGQELLRLDAQTIRQNAAARAAQVDAARSQARLADNELARQKQLFSRQYVSQAGLERAQAQAQAAHAQVRALQAQAGAAAAQAGLHIVRAPYSGVVSEVPVALGDMATTGRPLVRLYDPTALRIAAAAPQAWLPPGGSAQLEVPSLGAGRVNVPLQEVQRLPTVDRTTHTVQLRVALPPGFAAAAPGMFARLWLPGVQPAEGGRTESTLLAVPASAVLRRGELTAVYVLDEQQRPRLRQVRLGQAPASAADGQAPIPVLSGLRAGERVALDPQAAARVR